MKLVFILITILVPTLLCLAVIEGLQFFIYLGIILNVLWTALLVCLSYEEISKL